MEVGLVVSSGTLMRYGLTYISMIPPTAFLFRNSDPIVSMMCFDGRLC